MCDLNEQLAVLLDVFVRRLLLLLLLGLQRHVDVDAQLLTATTNQCTEV